MVAVVVAVAVNIQLVGLALETNSPPRCLGQLQGVCVDLAPPSPALPPKDPMLLRRRHKLQKQKPLLFTNLVLLHKDTETK